MASLGKDADESMEDEPTQYIIRKAFYKEYDPSYYHLSRSGHEKAQFARQEALFKTWKVEDPPIPIVTQIPPPHLSLGPVRFLVLDKGLLNILRLVLEDARCQISGHSECYRCISGAKRTNAMVLQRSIHLINVAVLVLKQRASEFILPQENEIVCSESKRRQTLALLRSGPEAYEDSDTKSRGKKRVKRQATSSDETNAQICSDSDQGDTSDVKDSSIVALLVAMARDMVKHDFDASKSTIAAIYWVLKELAEMDSTIHAYVELRVWSGIIKHEDQSAKNGMSKNELKKHHQQRAIAAMMARQNAFAQSSAFAEMDAKEDEAIDLDGSKINGDYGLITYNEISETTIIYRPPPPPDCIICSQKEKIEPIMYIGHAQMSRVSSHALKTVADDVETNVTDEEASAIGAICFPPPIHLSLCGHAVHLHCWQKYFESVRAQSRFNLDHSQTNIAFDANFGEFLCPLCQTLSSMLIPWLPICPPLTLADQQRDRDAMEQVFQLKQDTSSILSWLSRGLPSRLEAFAPQNDNKKHNNKNEDRRTYLQQQDDVRAMNQFAVGFLESMVRFQPEMAHPTSAMSALKKGFFSTGAQLSHLIWTSVASTITSTQLSSISSAVCSLKAHATSSKNGNKAASWRANSPARPPGRTGSVTAASSFSSLRITNILNPMVPCLATRVAVSLPEALDPQLDHFAPQDDSKLNILLRALRHMPLLFSNRHWGFYQSLCFPIAQNLRLALSAEQWLETLSQGPPLELGLPILSQDLLYLCVAICCSMLTTKADIMLTIRSLCVLYMAQVLIQLARMEAEDDDDCHEEDAKKHCANSGDGGSPEQIEEMQRGLETLMARLAHEAGVACVDQSDMPIGRRPAPQGRQLELLFKSSCLAFMRQVTLLCRAFFRGEQDPDASWSANFVGSLRLSTSYHGMCQQLGIPRIVQLIADENLVDYLLRAARELRTRPSSAAVSKELQFRYQQRGHADHLRIELEKFVSKEGQQGDWAAREALIARSNLRKIPKLPFRLEPDTQQGKRLFHFANIRLVKLPSAYTDLHSEVLGKSKCKQTWNTVENPAICLVCEEILCAGTECCRRRSDGMGACTYHASTCGAGVGLFFLMRSSSVLLIFGPRSSYFGSPYLDMFGEEDINVRRGRPLHLSAKRMKALQVLYASHQLANEVARNRRTSDQYIRNNYY
ncbi:hypothetical protein CCR75_002609 [Bremia lactucae]|uniref:E3 ubiquitin-protein ligase n=1 Tax=Bremia lactucae TaxID=4779 RepID=A0A976ILG7_BRELC|nr:hypothetical protein CCR75_002609 [Bremia lactucae]